MKKWVAMALVGLIATCAFGNDREQFSVGELTIESSIVNNGTLTQVGDVTQTGGLTIGGDITMANGMVQDNDTAKILKFIEDTVVTGASNLLSIVFESDNLTNNMADNQTFILDFQAADDATTTNVTYGKITVTATDVTDGTEDATVAIAVPVAGTETTVGTFSSSGLALASGDTVSVDGFAMLLSESNTPWRVETGTATADEAVTFGTAFASGTPIVLVDELGATGGTNAYAAGAGTTGFVCTNVANGLTCNWIAIGVK